ncbi:MAG: inositol monophosphatase family protein [Gallionella sp.]|nr:inositol monophosphatase family protein [Gallionella sp.]MDD4957732.1 inositol monophosphatase family protein [Gallionella sp.]
MKTVAPLGMSAVLKAVIAAVKLAAAEEIKPRYTKIIQQRKMEENFAADVAEAVHSTLTKKLQAIAQVPILDEKISPQEQHALWLSGEAWIINPIDSYSNLMRGLPYFSISVALLREGKVALGVVYAPVDEELFVAEAGKGAFLNGQKIVGSTTANTLDAALASVDFRRLNTLLIARLSIQPPYYTHRNFGACALDWCYIATGRYDVYLHGGQQLWDYAAGALILEEAGGFVCCIEQNDFALGNIWQRSVIASRDLKLFETWRDWVRG